MSHPCYGRLQAPDPPSELCSVHLYDGSTALKEVDHETPIAVLDQSDLVAQGIHTSRFIPGCKTDAQALGSCTANTTIELLAKLLGLTEFLAVCGQLIDSPYADHPKSYEQAPALERAAIAFYHRCTHQTGNPAQEWPPTDCGSSGPYMYSELVRLGVVKSQQIAQTPESVVSLLQAGPVAMGSPWFFEWEEPDTQGFIDGEGKVADVEAAIESGVAGGHETSLVAIEKLALLPTGHVDPLNTIIRGRNHWTRQWGDDGCYRVHLSTLGMINSQCDFRRFVA